MIRATGGNNSDLMEMNRSAVVRILQRREVCSRADIARETGLTQPAITKIVAALIEMGIVSEVGGIKGSGNRRSIGLTLNVDKHQIIGVRFSRQLIGLGVFNIYGKVHYQTEMPYGNDEPPLKVLDNLKRRVSDLLVDYPNVVAIGFALPGPYLRNEGRIAVITQMPAWRDINFKKELEYAFNKPVFIEHDANSGALAEWLFGDHPQSMHSLAYFLVGEGVGSGVIENGALLLGTQGCANEIGHMSTDVQGPECECGNHGCLEMYCSAKSLISKAVSRAPGAFEKMPHTCESVFQAARAGNQEVLSVIREVAEYIGYGCVSLIYAYNPDVIIIGDSVSEGRELILPTVQQIVRQRVLPEIFDKVQIKISELKINPTLFGAAAVATNKALQTPSMFLAT